MFMGGVWDQKIRNFEWEKYWCRPKCRVWAELLDYGRLHTKNFSYLI
jgi:hypothetical protein